MEGRDLALDSDTRNWAMFMHAGGFAAYTSIPFAGVILVLVLWLMKREQHPFIYDQGRESLNFQISVAIYSIVSVVLIVVLIGFVLLVAVFLFHVICTILAMLAASRGESYRYPLTIRLVS